MTFGDGVGVYKSIGAVDQSSADELVDLAFESGINFFDTADVYSFGQSETTLGQSFKNLKLRREDFVLATKVFMRVGKGRNDIGASRGHILDGVEASLRRLQTDHIDLYQIHASDPLTPPEETLRALEMLVQQGKVRYIGCSNWPAWEVARGLGIADRLNFSRMDTVQAYYSLAGRDLERELVPLIEAERLGLLVWSPLAGGLLSGKFSRDASNPAGARRTEFDFPIVDKERTWRILERSQKIAASHGCSAARVALSWLLSKPFVTSVILGAKNAPQLKDNLGAVELGLSDAELKQLDEVSQLPPEYPGWMTDVQGGGRLAEPDSNIWEGIQKNSSR